MYQIDTNSLPRDAIVQIKNKCHRLCRTFQQQWNSCNRHYQRTVEQIENSSNNTFFLPEEITRFFPSTSAGTSQTRNIPSSAASQSKIGRPTKEFKDLKSPQKRRRVAELEPYGQDQLIYAAQKSVRKINRDAATLIKETQASPTRASKILATVKSPIKIPRPYTAEEALALMIDENLSVDNYRNIRSGAQSRDSNIYPSYYAVKDAKEKCYPPEDSIIITDISAEVQLQQLLDHTAERLMLNNNEVKQLTPEELINIEITYKWGFDGSTGHSEYKQRYSSGESNEKLDSGIFFTSLVPIRATSGTKIIFQNPCPSSTRYCRPIRFQFIKETAEVSQSEEQHISRQIASLAPTMIQIANMEMKITHNMVLTMVDGKVCNAITENKSAQTCYICKATPKQMNDIETARQRSIDESTLAYGLSTLHAWIRFFEYFLHLSYRLEFKTWQVRSENNHKFKEKKSKVQQVFKEQLGLIVDKVRPGGAGTSNDGNTARRFFQNAEQSANITGLDVSLLKRCRTILQVISSNNDIKISEFDSFCVETAKLLVQKYPWYYMPTSVHKILVHGAQVITYAILPIGQLSEEAQESRNKHLKQYREHHTRKTSREATNEDLLHMLLLTSDPYISSLRRSPKTQKNSLSNDVLQFLIINDDEQDDIDAE